MSWFGPQSSEPLSEIPGHFPQNSNVSQAENFSTRLNGYLFTAIRTIGLAILRVLSSLVFLSASLVGGALKAIYFLDRPHWSPLSSSNTTISNVIKNDPIRRVDQFVLTLEDQLLPQSFSVYSSDSAPKLPPFFQGSYTQALYLATHKAQFLFVYLTNPKNHGSQEMLDKVITHPSFVTIFSQPNTLIWGGDVASPEAYELANNINISKFPMVGLLCLTRTTKMTPDGPQKSAPRTALVSKIQGVLEDNIDPETLIEEKFINKMAKYEPELALIRTELREKFVRESIRQSQDLKYQESLRKDHLKKVEQQRQKSFKKYLKWKQPSIKSLLGRRSSDGGSRIAIKFHNGESETLFFPADATIEDIFLFVEMKKRDMLESDYEVILSNAEAEHFQTPLSAYDFNLVTPIPPRVGLRGLDLNTPIKDLEFLHPSGRLLVDSI